MKENQLIENASELRNARVGSGDSQTTDSTFNKNKSPPTAPGLSADEAEPDVNSEGGSESAPFTDAMVSGDGANRCCCYCMLFPTKC